MNVIRGDLQNMPEHMRAALIFIEAAKSKLPELERTYNVTIREQEAEKDAADADAVELIYEISPMTNKEGIAKAAIEISQLAEQHAGDTSPERNQLVGFINEMDRE